MATDDPIFEKLLEHLRQSRGVDLSGYKRSGLQRRMQKQMQTRGIQTFSDYLDYLEVYPEEFTPLLNTILINVTGFFRDESAWNYLRDEILLPTLTAAAQEEIRIWSAGCASGEEAYTLMILLAELLGADQFCQRVKIYATDMDEEALNHARSATYTQQDLKPIATDLQEKYFAPLGDRWVVRPDLRRSVIFGRHDLMQDAPISHLDLLVCRNTLMYFNSETQSKILSRFHFGLKPTGILLLGRAEMLLTHGHLFKPLSLGYRIFSPNHGKTRNALLTPTRRQEGPVDSFLPKADQLQEAAFNAVAVAQIVVDVNENLVLANHQAQTLLNISQASIGFPLRDLEISYRPVELRSRIEQVRRDYRSIWVANVPRILPDGTMQYLDVQLMPLLEPNQRLLGISIAFTNITHYHQLQGELQRSNQELETANEELHSSNEELETTNEEVQSTNEELETTNEELQSTNEELETMNEELHSTNEELQTTNDQLERRTLALNQVNAFLQSILTSIQSGVIVIDTQFNILLWNTAAENLWGLRTEEVQGQSFFSLEMGLAVGDLHDIIRSCIAGSDRLELAVKAVNRRGKPFLCRITCNPLKGFERSQVGVILIMEEVAA